MFGIFSKGKLTLDLEEHQFTPGDTIKGKISLKLKKPLESKGLFVSLIGTEKRSSYRNGRRYTSYHEVFDFKQPLDKTSFFATNLKSYNFTIKIPKDFLTNPKLLGGSAKDVLGTAAIITGLRGTISWQVKTNLDVKGFDISKKVKINIV
jgi:hypothetical protein